MKVLCLGKLKRTIRYIWVFKINYREHRVEFVDGNFGKKELYIDNEEIINSRTFLGSNFCY